jgi:TolB protein
MSQGKLLIDSECINLETGAVVLKKTFLGQAATVNRMAHRLADFMVGKVTGTPGVADSTIVFARTTTPGIKEIFGVDRDGGNLRQLTAFGSLTTHPAVSADGKMALVTYKGGPPQIWGQLQPKGPFVRLHPKEGAPGVGISGLAWAPDGNRLCFVQENRKGLSDIYVLDLRTSHAVRLTEEGHTSRGPCWNPAGTEIAFLSDQEGTPQVFLMASDGSHVRRLTGDPAPKDCVSWNAQGDRIGYIARIEGRSDLFTLTPAGTGRQQVTSAAEPVESLCWAPDGRWLLLTLKGRNGSRLRIAGLDGKIQDLSDGLGGGQFPQWTQNPVPFASFTQADPFAVLPGSALAGPTPHH